MKNIHLIEFMPTYAQIGTLAFCKALRSSFLLSFMAKFLRKDIVVHFANETWLQPNFDADARHGNFFFIGGGNSAGVARLIARRVVASRRDAMTIAVFLT